jgi:hypothetical protein
MSVLCQENIYITQKDMLLIYIYIYICVCVCVYTYICIYTHNNICCSFNNQKAIFIITFTIGIYQFGFTLFIQSCNVELKQSMLVGKTVYLGDYFAA